MEFMDMALSDILSLEPEEEGSCISINESLIARIARDILRALTRIHRLNRIHRDIRSDNILLNLRGDVKLSKQMTIGYICLLLIFFLFLFFLFIFS